MGKLMGFTVLLITASLTFLLGYYVNPQLKNGSASFQKNSVYALPIAPNQAGIASTNVQYTIDGVLESVSSNSSTLTIQTSDGKTLGPYPLDPNTLIQKRSQGKITAASRGELKARANIRIDYVYKWTYDKKGSYISSILIK